VRSDNYEYVSSYFGFILGYILEEKERKRKKERLQREKACVTTVMARERERMRVLTSESVVSV